MFVSEPVNNRVNHYLDNYFSEHTFHILDWVFKVPHEYIGCEVSEDECEIGGAYKRHEFNRFVDADNSINVTCEGSPNSNELPDWVWRVKGKLVYFMNTLLRLLKTYIDNNRGG